MISRKGIILIASLFVVGAASGYLVKTQLVEKKVVTPVVAVVTNTGTVNTSTGEELSETGSELVSTSTGTTDSGVTTEKQSKHEYVLVSGLPVSYDLQNVLIALYDTTNHTINYLPYDYYIEQYNDKKDVSLGNLSSDQLKSFLQSKGVRIKDQVVIDTDVIFDLFTSVMSGTDYKLSYLDDNQKKIEITIKTKGHLFNVISKDNLNKFNYLEQLDNQVIKLLVEHNPLIKQKLEGLDPATITDSELYNVDKLLAVTTKQFSKQQINSKFFSVDTDSKWINSLLEDDFKEYSAKLVPVEVTGTGVTTSTGSNIGTGTTVTNTGSTTVATGTGATKPMTLKEKLEAMKKKK